MSNILEKQLYAGVMAVINDSQCFYKSSVGRHYDTLRPEGKEAIINYIEKFASLMIEQEQRELDARAKKMMWDELKK